MRVLVENSFVSKIRSLKPTTIAGLVAVLVLTLAVPITLYQTQQRQDLQQNAAEGDYTYVFGKAIEILNDRNSGVSREGSPFNLQTFTAEGWVKWSGADTLRQQPIIRKDIRQNNLPPASFEIALWRNPDGSQEKYRLIGMINMINNQSLILESPTNYLADTKWHHIALITEKSLSKNQVRLYVDGNLVQSKNKSNDILYENGDIFVGLQKYNPLDLYSFKGQIDEVRMSNISRYSTNFTPSLTPFSPDANTVALWHFNDNSNDASQNALNFTFGNGINFVNSTISVIPTSLVPKTPTQLELPYPPKNNVVTVNWRDNSTNETKFDVQYKFNDGNWNTVSVPNNYQVYDITNVPSNATVRIQVRACNANGCSEWSNELVVQNTVSPTPNMSVIPSPPSEVKATNPANTNTVAVQWKDNSNNEEYFNIAWSNSSAPSSYQFSRIPANTTQTSIAITDKSVDYNFQVQACNPAGCSKYVGVPLVFTTAPAAPTNVKATYANGNTTLTWTDNATDEIKYQVVWSNTQNGSNYTYVDVPANGTSWTHSAVIPNMAYNYHVRACKYNNNCSALVGTSVTTSSASVPTAPSNLRLGIVSSSSAELMWNDNSSDETKFQIAYANSSAPSSYQFADIPAGTTTWIFSPRNPALNYNFHVKACNGTSCSDFAPGIVLNASQ